MNAQPPSFSFAAPPLATDSTNDSLITVPFFSEEDEKSPLAAGGVAPSEEITFSHITPPVDQPIMQRLSPAKQRQRRYLHALTNGALVQEFLFLFFQYAATLKGLENLNFNNKTAQTIAVPLSLADWLVNVLAVSVPADADSVLFSVKDPLSGCWAHAEKVFNGISLIACYAVGAAADALPLLALVSQDLAKWQLALINYSLILVNILPGASYYRLFNHAKIDKHFLAFKALCENPSLPFKRFYQKPVNILSSIEILRGAIAVVGYRAINFAFIAQALGPYLLAPTSLETGKQETISDSLALIALIGTALNVSFSRLLAMSDRLANIQFDILTSEEYNQAAIALRQDKFLSCHTLSAAAGCLPNAITALGWALLTSSLIESRAEQILLATLIGLASFTNSLYVDYRALVSMKALKTLSQSDIQQRLLDLYDLSDNPSPSLQPLASPEASIKADLKEVKEKFEQLAENFASHSLSVNTGLMLINIGARAARAIGFYGFVKTLTQTLSDYTGVSVDDTQILALCFILAPENFKNELAVFDDSMKDVIKSWLTKCYLEKYRLKLSALGTRIVRVCLQESPYDFSLTTIKDASIQCQQEQRHPTVSPTVSAPLLPTTSTLRSYGGAVAAYIPLLSGRTASSCTIM